MPTLTMLCGTAFISSSDTGRQDKEAYATLLTTKDYVQGAVVVARALRAFGTTRPIVALVTKELLKDASITKVLKEEVGLLVLSDRLAQ